MGGVIEGVDGLDIMQAMSRQCKMPWFVAGNTKETLRRSIWMCEFLGTARGGFTVSGVSTDTAKRGVEATFRVMSMLEAGFAEFTSNPGKGDDSCWDYVECIALEKDSPVKVVRGLFRRGKRANACPCCGEDS